MLLNFLLVCCLFPGFLPAKTGGEDFDKAKRRILIRKVGHEILLYAGDSTSRVLPVQNPHPNEYQIGFESDFSFEPDSLVRIIDQTLIRNNCEEDYIVNVLNCGSGEVVFGYAILGSEQNEIVPCAGRPQPKSCYQIHINFREAKKESASFWFPGLGGAALLLLVGAIFLMRRRKQNTPAVLPVSESAFLSLGKLKFYPEERRLAWEGGESRLTEKEAKLLHIFAVSRNVIIARKSLQADVWESEGVIVGRSLDVYISKLRKKLSADPDLRLANVHGKGYRLEGA